ncbi:MAG: inositol monophosphatase/fructose-1,6-bisphosphatase family protein [Parcubacteria group bacterium Gr01-1014_38]|nr:MAG: inositol monophosphatase/fructose-1,6-bisphosphatase family protein [Parcubacteria group bacterium Gr01-1014_38]
MIETLERAVRACGDLLLEIREKGLRTEDKDEQLGAHFSTQGDTLSQARGIEILREKFPDEIVIAEEQENAAEIPPNCTVFDPLDGTIAYYNGCREFGVTLCTLRGGQPHAGVMYFPVDRMMISAVRGEGCSINGEKFTIRWDRPLDKTMIGIDVGPWTVYEVVQPLAKRFCVRSIMVAVYDARAVLLGETGAYFSLNIAKIWDAAAGVLAVEEAGGVACAPDGSPLRWNAIAADWILAANRELAEHILPYTTLWKGRAS